MRRNESEITDRAAIEAITQETKVCRMGLCDRGTPYVVLLNFGYRDGKVYMHSAVEGRKLDIIRKNPDVCLVFEVDMKMKSGPEACAFTTKYRSVMAWGKASIPEEPEEKAFGMNILMRHCT